ncbi:MAG: MarR family transcriptional regulator [Burkholderiales bacterium]
MSPTGIDAPARATDLESRATDDHHEALRLWLRLLTCAALIERGVRRRLRDRFATTLPRFDLMAQLERAPAGLRMGELSRRMMVSGGNVTGIVDQLASEGMVERRAMPGDRRVQSVRLTDRGREAFGAMAREHERWIVEMTAGLAPADLGRLHTLLGRLKASVRDREPEPGPAEEDR